MPDTTNHCVIKTDADHAMAMARIAELLIFPKQPGTPEGDELELLVTLVEIYEQRFPTDLPDPITAIKFRMEQQGLTQKDLIPYIGSRSKVSEVLSGKHPLSLAMIKALHRGLDIPADVLIKEYEVAEIETSEPTVDVGHHHCPLCKEREQVIKELAEACKALIEWAIVEDVANDDTDYGCSRSWDGLVAEGDAGQEILNAEVAIAKWEKK